MNPKLKAEFNKEMQQAREHYDQRDLDQAFAHLERAHILGQSYIIPHTISHIWMLRVGWHRGDVREVVGQTFRIIASLIVSRIWVPVGNTGGANVSPLLPMPVPGDLARILRDAGRPAAHGEKARSQ